MRSKAFLVLSAAFLLVLPLLPSAPAQTTADLTFTGDQLADCDPTALEALCWNIEGDLEATFVAGRDVTITVVAPGEAPHNLYFIADGEQDATTYDTNASGAIAGSETVQHGNETTFSFTVPDDTEALYYWCDVGLPVAETGGDHELVGMRGTVNITPASDDGATGDDGAGEGTDDGADADNGTAADDNGTADEGSDDDSTGSDDRGAEAGNEAADEDPAAEDADQTDANDTSGATVQGEESTARSLPLPMWVGLLAAGGTMGLARLRT